MLTIKRVYDEPSKDDGYRVLVDRLWPRGVRKEEAAIDMWLKDVAPTPDLRKWFGHQPEKFDEFSHLYTQELQENIAVRELKNLIANHKQLTLLYGAKDTQYNHAVVLRDFFKK